MATAVASGIVRLEHLGVLAFSGADAQAFLHGQFSCDVGRLAEGDATFGSYNTPKGRMLATFLVWRTAGGFLLLLTRALAEPMRRRLAMFILRSKVTVRDASDEMPLYGVAGHALAALEADAGRLPAADLKTAVAHSMQILRLDANRCIVTVAGENPRESLEGLRSGLPSLALSSWQLADIGAGIPYITPATQDQFVPQMANLDLIGGVSFNKGCYPGQEIVARTHYLGRLKQRMYLLEFAGTVDVQPGAPLYSIVIGEQATGMIVNAAPAPDGRQIALGVMHIESRKSGDVHVHAPDGPQAGFLALPYTVPE